MSPAGVGRSADKPCSYESEQREGRRTAGDSGGRRGTAGRELRTFEALQPRGYSEGEGRGMELQAASGRAVRYSNTPSSPLCLKGWKTIINVVKDAERGEKGGKLCHMGHRSVVALCQRFAYRGQTGSGDLALRDSRMWETCKRFLLTESEDILFNTLCVPIHMMLRRSPGATKRTLCATQTLHLSSPPSLFSIFKSSPSPRASDPPLMEEEDFPNTSRAPT